MIYISGRLDVDRVKHYEGQFMGAEEYLQEFSRMYTESKDNILNLYTVYNSIPHIDELDMADEVELRLDMVRKCDRLYLLQGWELSDLCRLEAIYAKYIHKRITYSKKY